MTNLYAGIKKLDLFSCFNKTLIFFLSDWKDLGRLDCPNTGMFFEAIVIVLEQE